LALLGLTWSDALALAGEGESEGQALASKGYELFNAGKPAEALAALKDAALRDPGNPWVFNLLGRVYYQGGQSGEAVENFRAALRIDQGDGYARMMLDMLSQHPVKPPKKGTKLKAPMGPESAEAEKARRPRPSQLETDAGLELDDFVKNGGKAGKKVVVIDPGHGGADKGVTADSGLAEKDVCLALAKKTAENMGEVEVLLTREADVAAPLWARGTLAGLFGADMFVSLHCSAALPGQGGVQVYTFEREASDAQGRAVADMENGVTRFERSKAPVVRTDGVVGFLTAWQARRLKVRAKEVADALVRDFSPGKPLEKVGAAGAPLAVLVGLPCPGVLIETGFLSNGAEAAALGKTEYVENMAKSLAMALTRSLG